MEKWSPFFSFGVQSAFFWHLNTGTNSVCPHNGISALQQVVTAWIWQALSPRYCHMYFSDSGDAPFSDSITSSSSS